MMKNIVNIISLGMTLMVYSVASNAATLNISNGSLLGASGVDVNGTLYDVQFLDGTCAELYNGCDESSDFPFTDPDNPGDTTLIKAAATALFEQVLIDSPLGNFDSNPDLTNGCVVEGGCQINTVFNGSGGAEFVSAIGAFNSTAIEQVRQSRFDHLTAGGAFFDSNPLAFSPDTDLSVFAVWNQSTAVPVPPAIWLFLSGVLGLVGIGRKHIQPSSG